MNDEAGTRFSEAERRLFEAVWNKDGWRPKGVEPVRIRASFLASLILGRPAFTRLMDEHGVIAAEELAPDSDIIIDGDGRVEIVGDLDLSRQRFGRNIFLSGVRMAGGLLLNDAVAASLFLRNCRLEYGLSATQAEFRGPVDLRDVEANKELDFAGVTIWGPLTAKGFECLGKAVINTTALTVEGRIEVEELKGFDRLDLSDLRAKRSVHLSNFDLSDGLCLDNAEIGGTLRLRGIHFGRPGEEATRNTDKRHERAVSADNITISGSVVFENADEPQGQEDKSQEKGENPRNRVYVYSGGVRFQSAKIEGDLDLRGLTTSGCDHAGIALDVRGSHIGGSARLDFRRDKFDPAKHDPNEFDPAEDDHNNKVPYPYSFESTHGSVLFHATRIDGSLELTGAFIGGFNDGYFNSLAIYACQIRAKLEIEYFRLMDSEKTCKVSPNDPCRRICRRKTQCPPKDSDNVGEHSKRGKYSFGLWPPIGFSRSPWRVSPKVSIIQTKAAIFEIGRPITSRKDLVSPRNYWSLFDIEKLQLTLSGLRYERLEESTFLAGDWTKLLKKSTPFTDRAEPAEKEDNNKSYTYSPAERNRQKHRFDPDIWTQAARVIDRQGHQSDARKIRHARDCWNWWSLWWRFRNGAIRLRIRDKNFNFEGLPGSVSSVSKWFWNLLLWFFIGFGHKAHRAVIIAFFATVLAGWALWALPGIKTSDSSPHNPMIYAVEVFIPAPGIETAQNAYQGINPNAAVSTIPLIAAALLLAFAFIRRCAVFLWVVLVGLPIAHSVDSQFSQHFFESKEAIFGTLKAVGAYLFHPLTEEWKCLNLNVEWALFLLRVVGLLTFAFGIIAFTPLVKRD